MLWKNRCLIIIIWAVYWKNIIKSGFVWEIIELINGMPVDCEGPSNYTFWDDNSIGVCLKFIDLNDIQ